MVFRNVPKPLLTSARCRLHYPQIPCTDTPIATYPDFGAQRSLGAGTSPIIQYRHHLDATQRYLQSLEGRETLENTPRQVQFFRVLDGSFRRGSKGTRRGKQRRRVSYNKLLPYMAT